MSKSRVSIESLFKFGAGFHAQCWEHDRVLGRASNDGSLGGGLDSALASAPEVRMGPTVEKLHWAL